MKCIIFSVLLCTVALEAKPYGYGDNMEDGIGDVDLGEDGVGIGSGRYNGMGMNRGLGGLSRGQSEYAHGAQFGNNRVNAGSSGIRNQGYQSQGAGGFHNQGFHHKKVTNIHQAEESESHNIGGGQTYHTGAHSGSGFNNYLNGANNYGSQFGQGGASQQGVLL